jgi:hypothetical protein
MIKIVQHSSSKYSPRTKLNAKLGDITVAFFIDCTTAGEVLTKSASASRYVGIHLDTPIDQAVKRIYAAMYNKGAATLNIAGNGIYTLNKFGVLQQDVNTYIVQVIEELYTHIRITKIFSGGQTGADLAGIIAAKYLDIDALITLPKGYIQRYEDKVDVTQNLDIIKKQIDYWLDKYENI